MSLIHCVVILIINLSLNLNPVVTDCGQPGQSRHTAPSPEYLRPDRTYPENYTIAYPCPNRIIGNFDRQCKDGRWQGSIPKCSALLNVTATIHAAGQSIYVNWFHKAPVVGLQFGIRRLGGQIGQWPGVEFLKVDAFYRIYTDIKDGYTEDTKIVEIGLAYVDLRRYLPVNLLVVKTNISLYNCLGDDLAEYNATSAAICVMSGNNLELYQANEDIDDCGIPDAPLNATVSSFRDIDGLNSTIICDQGLKLKNGALDRTPFCYPNGDWSVYEFGDVCEPATCDATQFKSRVVIFQPGLNFDDQAGIETRGIRRCSTLTDERYIECSSSGQWSEDRATCPGKATKTTFYETSPPEAESDNDSTLVVVSAISGILFVVCICLVGFLVIRSRRTKITVQCESDVTRHKSNSQSTRSNLRADGTSVRYSASPGDFYEYEQIDLQASYSYPEDGYVVPTGSPPPPCLEPGCQDQRHHHGVQTATELPHPAPRMNLVPPPPPRTPPYTDVMVINGNNNQRHN